MEIEKSTLTDSIMEQVRSYIDSLFNQAVPPAPLLHRDAHVVVSFEGDYSTTAVVKALDKAKVEHYAVQREEPADIDATGAVVPTGPPSLSVFLPEGSQAADQVAKIVKAL